MGVTKLVFEFRACLHRGGGPQVGVTRSAGPISVPWTDNELAADEVENCENS